MSNPFRYFKSSPEVIRLVVMMYVRYPLSLRNVEDLLAERGIDICHETVRLWWNRFGPMFAAEIKKRRLENRRGIPEWRWHLDEVFVKINGELHYLWRAVDHEGEVLEVVATKRRDRKAALGLLKTLMKKYGRPHAVVTDRCRSYGAAMKEIGNADHQRCEGRWINNRAENSHQPMPSSTTTSMQSVTSSIERPTPVQRRAPVGEHAVLQRTALLRARLHGMGGPAEGCEGPKGRRRPPRR
jgi:putative transposase